MQHKGLSCGLLLIKHTVHNGICTYIIAVHNSIAASRFKNRVNPELRLICVKFLCKCLPMSQKKKMPLG